MARRRSFSPEPFGRSVERLMNERGLSYRGLAERPGLFGRLHQPPRPRQPAGAVERGHPPPRRVARRQARALPRVPPAPDYGAARSDTRTRRPALRAPHHLAGLLESRRTAAGGDL